MKAWGLLSGFQKKWIIKIQSMVLEGMLIHLDALPRTIGRPKTPCSSQNFRWIFHSLYIVTRLYPLGLGNIFLIFFHCQEIFTCDVLGDNDTHNYWRFCQSTDKCCKFCICCSSSTESKKLNLLEIFSIYVTLMPYVLLIFILLSVLTGNHIHWFYIPDWRVSLCYCRR